MNNTEGPEMRFGRAFAYKDEKGELKSTRAVLFKFGELTEDSNVGETERVFDFFLQEVGISRKCFMSDTGRWYFNEDGATLLKDIKLGRTDGAYRVLREGRVKKRDRKVYREIIGRTLSNLKSIREEATKSGPLKISSEMPEMENVFFSFLEELIFKSRPRCFLFTLDIGVI